MALPWARTDTNIATHDKILSLANDPSPRRWQALSSYLVAYPWSVGQGTDGVIPSYALQTVFGTPQTARLLVKHRLWIEEGAAWRIVNFDKRQPTADVAESALLDKRNAGAKGNCVRWHGADCWQKGRCTHVA